VGISTNVGGHEELGVNSDPFSDDSWDRSQPGIAAGRSATTSSWDWDNADPLSDSKGPSVSRDPQGRHAGRASFVLAALLAVASVIAAVSSASSGASRTVNVMCFVLALMFYGGTWIRYTAKRVESHLVGGRHRVPSWIAVRLIALAGAVWAAWNLAQVLAL